MSERHFTHWPRHLPRRMTVPETDLFYNAEVSARRFPEKPFLIFYDTRITFAEFRTEAEKLAGWLEHEGVCKGDRVLLYTQNSPQFVLGYYAILRANAVVVPINPMNTTHELRHYLKDTGARVAIVAQDLLPQMQPLLGEGLGHILVATYADYLREPTDLKVPDFIRVARQAVAGRGVTLWADALAQALQPSPVTVGPEDLCVLPYTSGTTGPPKGCMHTHRSVMHTTVSGVQWFAAQQDAVALAVLPFFHVSGMQGSMNCPMFAGNSVVLLPRWDREVAAQCIERYTVSHWSVTPTMIVDLLSNPSIGKYNLSSLKGLSGGGAAMPEAIAQKLLDQGLVYVEGYGLSETMSASHLNPQERAKKQCLGIPVQNVESIVIDPETSAELPAHARGEIVIRGPQLFLGYWNNPEATQEAFVEIDGRRWFRTGDIGYVDEDGYFFIVDRLKRMINASGFKVWPVEIETSLCRHPAVLEACIIGVKDPYRGETVKAVIALKPDHRGRTGEAEIIDWARANMAAYKVPRIIEFVDALPKSATGKVNWRLLQD
ncbi:MAG: long-chain fatty acid--CoA ligase [Steroidobacteraceae bacterium]